MTEGKFSIKAILFLVWSVVFNSSGYGQSPVYRVLDYESGLPSNTVYSILQDSKGYIWLSHEKGLSRYNGQELQNYSNNMLQSRGLSNLSEDAKGRIWCQNFSGDIFFSEKGRLILNKNLKATGNFTPTVMYQGKMLLTVRGKKIEALDLETGKISTIPGIDDAYGYSYMAVFGSELYLTTQGTRHLVYLKDLKKIWDIELPADIHPYIMVKFDGKILVLPRMGTDKYAIIRNGQIVETGVLNISSIIQNLVVTGNSIWVSTTNGAYCFNKKLSLQNGGKPYFPDQNISCIKSDYEGSLWISTLNSGVFIVPNLQVKLLDINGEFQTNASYFSSIDKIITGTSTNKIYEIDPNSLQKRLLIDLKIKSDVLQLYNDIENDRIWVASDKLYAIRGASNTVEYSEPFPMKSLDYIGRGIYAVASPDGISLFCIDPALRDQYYAKKFTRKEIPWIGSRQLIPGSEGRAKAVAFDKAKGVLYGSNFKGLYSWSLNGEFIKYTYRGEPVFASAIVVKGNKTYVTSFSGKLFIIENGKITGCIEEFKGLEGQSIYKLKSSGNYLWLLFENALVRFNTLNNQYSILNRSDGLPNTEIKDIAVGDGNVFLVGNEGLVFFNEKLQRLKSHPRLLIEQVVVNLKPAEMEEGVYQLRTNENNLEIHLSVLSFRNNSGIRILYNINKKHWQELGSSSRTLNLVGLAPGNYEVKFKSVTSDGREIAAGEVLKFNIAAPMYTRWWFILLVLILVSLLVFYFMRFRIYELKKEAEFKSAKERLERELQISTLASIKSQMNPHFVFNALNTVQSYIFTNDRENATDYLSKFSELTRMILDMSNKEKIPLAEEIKALTLYLELEKRRFEDSIEYQIVVNENISPEMVQIPSMLIQPYVENAIKHGLLHKRGDRKIKIEILKEGNAVIVFIDDNGIGRKKSQELKALKPSSHRSFASEANKKRLQLLNQGRENTIDIEYLDKLDSYGNSLGTMVILAIPLNF